MTMADTPAQVALDERALLKARNVVKSHDIATIDYALEVGIRAYLSSLSADAGDDGQGALVERLRRVVSRVCEALGNGAAHAPECSIEFMECVPQEVALVVAALRADKERLEQERDTARKNAVENGMALCRMRNLAEAAERRLAEQGQAQGEACGEIDANGVAQIYDNWFLLPETKLYATQPSPEPDAELVEALGKVESFINEPSQYEDQKLVRDYRHELYRVWSPLCSMILRRRKQGGE